MEFFDPKQLRLQDYLETWHYQSQPNRDHQSELMSQSPRVTQCLLDAVDPTLGDIRADLSPLHPNLFDGTAVQDRP